VCPAVAEDVSAGGVALLAARPFDAEEVLALCPGGPPPLAGRRLAFRVSRCEPQGGGFHLAGAFLSPLTDADVRALAGG
jgi:hypothetical protein